MDASGNMDRQNTRVFLLMTHSAASGLPLGVLILSNEQWATITAALQLYLTLLNYHCFRGRGAAGPAIFMTDDSTAERTALQEVFPQATLLLCAFHLLQAYLWDLISMRSSIRCHVISGMPVTHSTLLPLRMQTKLHPQTKYSTAVLLLYCSSTAAVLSSSSTAAGHQQRYCCWCPAAVPPIAVLHAEGYGVCLIGRAAAQRVPGCCDWCDSPAALQGTKTPAVPVWALAGVGIVLEGRLTSAWQPD